MELERVGIPALPEVETTLNNEVSGIARDTVSHSGLSSRFLGIDDLLRYYLRVGLISEPTRVTETISKFPPALLSAVLDVSCLAFKEVKNVSPQLEVPDVFNALVATLANAENAVVANSAQRAGAALQKLHKKTSR